MSKWAVIGVDAGIHTGLALRVQGDENVHTATVLFPKDFSTTGQARTCVRSLDYIQEWIDDRININMNLLFSVELFRQYAGSVSATSATTSAQWIHAQMVAYYTREYEDRAHWCRFTAGTAKSSVTDQRLKDRGLWIAGNDQRHVRDALRVMVLGEKKL
jgi:hypothetical protein